MSIHKSKRSEQSPFAANKQQQKATGLVFDFNQKKLETLQCFFTHKRPIKSDIKKQSRLKSVSSTQFKPETRQQQQLTHQHQTLEVVDEPEDNPRLWPREASKEPRKKETSNSPDISKLLMNQVIHKIQKEGICSRWREEQKVVSKPEEQACQAQKDCPPEQVQRIWLKQNQSHLSTDNTIVSNISPRPDYPAYMLHHYSYSNSYSGSFNTSFAYSDDQYPDYYNESKNYVVNRRIFEIDYDNIEKDGRTTVMIKNIPNKYTRNLLYEEINLEHENTYDFLYLPFDFNNNCNVGYAFINFLTPQYLKKFYECYNEKRWSKFRSLKICVLTYARLQGRQSLIEHFYNSKVLNQKEKRYRPIIKDFTSLETLLEKQRKSQPQ